MGPLFQPARPAVDGLLDDLVVDLARLVGLEHRFLARVFQVGRTEDGVLWIATELLMGETLETILARRQTIPAGTALRLVSEIAEAVAEAHAAGVVHGGLLPRAIVLHRDQENSFTPKLVDFGRVRFLGQRPDVRWDVAGLRELLLDCVGRDRSDTRVDGLVELCLAGRIATARDFARAARIAADSRAAGLTALLRMARVPDEWLDVERTGEIDHWPTIPGMGPGMRPGMRPGVGPGPVGPRTARRDIAPTTFDPLDGPLDDVPFVDFRPGRWLGPRTLVASCVAVLAFSWVAMRSPSPPEARYQLVRMNPAFGGSILAAAATDVHRAIAPASPALAPPRAASAAAPNPVSSDAPKPTPSANLDTPAVVRAPTSPKRVETPGASSGDPPKGGAASIPANAGIPLWDTKPKPVVDDNPYE